MAPALPSPTPPSLTPASLTSSPDTPASPSAEEVEAAYRDNALAQVLYHDWEAGTYDEKWSISFDDRCTDYARDRFDAAVGPDVVAAEVRPYGRALEVGAGTGFFSLNLRQGGVVREVTVTDVSSGMVAAAQANAERLGFHVDGRVAGATELPFGDGTFDVVLGHAVLHHVPDVEAAVREALRVLRPGGRFVFAGEPTRIGHRYARRLGQVTWNVTTAVAALPPLRERWARSREELDESSRAAALEAVVDLHTFDPGELARAALRAGAVDVRTQTEELTAAFIGWPVRTFEVAVKEGALGHGWARFAFGAWQRLSAVDRRLAAVVPAQWFYNVGVTGVRPD
ncbi:MAG TPA: class I SAM-dependent methyltransferase [Dermatophilaceae bacterium]|nr:class I SAM-dependent methyltransferase [Dermatophilaceae bacterium]